MMPPNLATLDEFSDYALFDQQLRRKELNSAAATLLALQKDCPGARTDACAVRLECKRFEREKALDGLQRLCFAPAADTHALEQAATAVIHARWGREAEKLFSGLIGQPGVNTLVGALWVKRFTSRKAWNHRRRVSELDPASPMGKEARIAYIRATAKHKQPQYLHRLIKREKETLQNDSQYWGQAGYAFYSNQLYRETTAWMSDWKKRRDTEPWMLANLVLAQRCLGLDAEASEVSLHALSLPGDHTTHQHQLWVACDEAIAGKTDSARVRLATVPRDGLPELFKALQLLAEAVLSVQASPENGRRAIFEMQRQMLRQQRLQPFYSDDALHGLARRGVKVMAKAARARTFSIGGSPSAESPSLILSNLLPILIVVGVLAVIVWACFHMWDSNSVSESSPGMKLVPHPTPSAVRAPTDSLGSFSKDAVKVDFRDENGKSIEFKIDQETGASPTPPP